MAAITTATPGMQFQVLRSVTAQATTGQTDWLYPPANARYAVVFLNLTAVAGTTPTLTPSFLAADPVSANDSHTILVGEHAALTAITAAGHYIYQIGPGVSGIADDVTQSATADSVVSINAILPTLMGFKILNDRADGDETYTYNLSVRFRS